MSGSIFVRYIIVILISGISLGLLGPLETIERFSFVGRMAFWVAACAAGWLQSMIIARGLKSMLINSTIKNWQLAVITAVILAIPLTFEIRWMWQSLTMTPTETGQYWVSYLITLVINLNFCTLQLALIERWPLLELVGRHDDVSSNEEVDNHSANKEVVADVSMLRRKPDGISGPILALKTEDHYLRVYTADGNNLVLSRMSDACFDLKSTHGLQVHRSWWVSVPAIKKFAPSSRQGELVLENELVVPVSRANVKKLSELLENP